MVYTLRFFPLQNPVFSHNSNVFGSVFTFYIQCVLKKKIIPAPNAQTWISGEESQGLTTEEMKTSEKKWGGNSILARKENSILK